jgi:hypothetical protein
MNRLPKAAEEDMFSQIFSNFLQPVFRNPFMWLIVAFWKPFGESTSGFLNQANQ